MTEHNYIINNFDITGGVFLPTKKGPSDWSLNSAKMHFGVVVDNAVMMFA